MNPNQTTADLMSVLGPRTALARPSSPAPDTARLPRVAAVGLAPHLDAVLRDPTWQLLDDPYGEDSNVVVAARDLARLGSVQGAWGAAAVLAILPPGGDPSEPVELFGGGADGCVASDDPREVHAHLLAVVRRLTPTAEAPPTTPSAGGPEFVHPPGGRPPTRRPGPTPPTDRPPQLPAAAAGAAGRLRWS